MKETLARTETIIRTLVLMLASFVLISSCCSFPYRVNTTGTPGSELAQVHLYKAEIVKIDGKTVSVKKALLPAHLVIKQGAHEMTVNYWAKTVFSNNPKKIKFTAKPGKKYVVKCRKLRAGKTADKKDKNARYIFKRKGNEYLKDEQGYLYTFECCLKDKETGEQFSCQ